MKSTILAAAAAMAGLSHAAKPIYLNPNATVEDRVADLLPRMSLREKASQLVQGDMRDYIDIKTGVVNDTGLDWVMEYRGHAIWTGLAVLPEIVKKSAKVAQDYLVNDTELGIPAYIQSEGLHGFLAWNATIFNSPIAMACAFNPELIEEMAKVIGIEAKALGVNQLFSPVVDLARELRFGRVEETFGEDAYLWVSWSSTFLVVMAANTQIGLVSLGTTTSRVCSRRASQPKSSTS